jgi:hypothetical protein
MEDGTMASVSDRLKKVAAKPTSKSGKNPKPVVSGAEQLVDDVVATKKALEDLEAKYAELEGSLKELTYAAYDEARRNGQFSNSIMCEGSKTTGCIQVYSDKFSAFPTEMEGELRRLDPNYDKHFVEVRKISIKADQGKTISDKRIEEILNALGDKFDEWFEVKVSIGAVSGMAERFEELPDTLKDMLKDLQAKPSTRNVTADGKVV